MELLIISFLAGVLTVASPCVLALLPVIVGGSILRAGGNGQAVNWRRPVVIALSLALSVIAFGLLLKATTALLGVPQATWQLISGLIVLALGLSFLLPTVWQKLSLITGLRAGADRLMAGSHARGGYLGDGLIGFSLGPVFNSCSPTYALIIAVILPVSFISGLTYLTIYAVGLSVALLAIAFAGQNVASKLGWLSNPSGWFRKSIGIAFVLVGLAVVFGLDREAQQFMLDRGWHGPSLNVEKLFR